MYGSLRALQRVRQESVAFLVGMGLGVGRWAKLVGVLSPLVGVLSPVSH